MNDLDRWVVRFPSIRWRDPQRIVLSGVNGWVCRVCIAERGLAGHETDRVFEAYDDCVDHILRKHIR